VRAEIEAGLPDHEAAALDRIGSILGEEAVWDGPPPELKNDLMAQVAAEAATVDPGPEPEVVAQAPAGDRLASPGDELAQRRRRRSGRLVIAGAGLVAAAAAAIAVFGFATRDTGDVTTYDVAGTELTPDLNATVDIEPRSAGVAITLNIMGLPPAPEGQYYAGWLATDDGSGAMNTNAELVGVGSFHWREGGIPIELWSGVETESHPLLIVTLQTIGEPPTPSGVVVMTARVDGA
ncbi:MAG: hypothetical protein AAF467_19445, partial [Actinomycetota bacterium]